MYNIIKYSLNINFHRLIEFLLTFFFSVQQRSMMVLLHLTHL